jgi:hypothetical protein
MNPQLGWWPFGTMTGTAPGQLNQPILPDWSLQRIDVNFAGDIGIEKEVVANVASYGKQLGIITDAVLALASGHQADESIKRLREIADEVEKIKKERERSLADQARAAMEKLAKLEPDMARQIAFEYAARRNP